MLGIPGMIIGVPLFAVIYAAIRAMVNASLTKRNLPTDTALYEHMEFVGEDGFKNFDEPVHKKKKKKSAPSSAEGEESAKPPRSGKSFVSNNEQWKRLYHFDKKITTEEESGKKE